MGGSGEGEAGSEGVSDYQTVARSVGWLVLGGMAFIWAVLRAMGVLLMPHIWSAHLGTVGRALRVVWPLLYKYSET